MEKEVLFDGHDEFFIDHLQNNSRIYAEFGCGASTIWVAQNTDVKIYSIDTSVDWINFVRSKVQEDRLTLHFVNVGELLDWGRPKSYTYRTNFEQYTDWFWIQKIKPDTILIDGRFRVCCFLTALKHAEAGTTIIFDDYSNRPHYHLVEEWIKPCQFYGRQAVFIVPAKNTINLDKLNKEIEMFRYVMD